MQLLVFFQGFFRCIFVNFLDRGRCGDSWFEESRAARSALWLRSNSQGFAIPSFGGLFIRESLRMRSHIFWGIKGPLSECFRVFRMCEAHPVVVVLCIALECAPNRLHGCIENG